MKSVGLSNRLRNRLAVPSHVGVCCEKTDCISPMAYMSCYSHPQQSHPTLLHLVIDPSGVRHGDTETRVAGGKLCSHKCGCDERCNLVAHLVLERWRKSSIQFHQQCVGHLNCHHTVGHLWQCHCTSGTAGLLRMMFARGAGHLCQRGFGPKFGHCVHKRVGVPPPTAIMH